MKIIKVSAVVPIKDNKPDRKQSTLSKKKNSFLPYLNKALNK